MCYCIGCYLLFFLSTLPVALSQTVTVGIILMTPEYIVEESIGTAKVCAEVMGERPAGRFTRIFTVVYQDGHAKGRYGIKYHELLASATYPSLQLV